MKASVFTSQKALVALYLLNDYRRVAPPPNADWFVRQNVTIGLAAQASRRSAIRLARQRECGACGRAVAEDSEGDHVIPVSLGGPAGLDNFWPVCQPCNSSKGTRDLLDWWAAKGRPADGLPPDVLTIYCRLMHGRLAAMRRHREPASDGARRVLRGLYDALPTDAHRVALLNRVSAVVGS